MVNKRIKQMSLGVILSYVSIAVKLISGIVYTPVVLHSLGQGQYGVYSLCVSFIGYLTILNAGVNAAYIRFYVQEKTTNAKNVDRLNGLFCKIFIALSIIGLIGGMLIAHFSPMLFGSKITPSEYTLVKKCFILLAFTIAIEIFTCLFKSFVTANEEFIFGKSLDIIGAVLAPVLTLPFLSRGSDCTVIVGVRLCVSALLLVLNMFFCWRKLHISFLFANSGIGVLQNIAQFIGFIALQSIMDQLNWQIDKLILARTHGTAEISVYSVGGTFNTYFLMIGGAVSGVFIAQINRLVAANDAVMLNNLFRRTCKLFTYLIGYIITAFIIFGRSFIIRWAGQDYVRSFSVGWMLMTPVSFALIMGLGQDIARAMNKHQIQIVINVCVCVVNMLVSIPLAIRFGATGSAFGTFAAEIIVCIVIQPIYYKKVLGLDTNGVFGDIIRYIPGLIPAAVFGLMINHLALLKNDYVSIIIYGILFTVIYVVGVMLLSLRKKERETCIHFIKMRILKSRGCYNG